ncbi:breast cancer anti-estrogen resistance protein 1 isoform X1 [Zootermopsis nevadensis]|uniref:breast cancer anti-estrogen resistance protein 1 isoform X1 n=1 Tax=Zootermopsis nevadensis TaxID=136037 RepID=UPI000B8E35FC|nr:breast cancer anti-estrogen resistance protein 1 isoform X1 [Zootermopsis nevadensis]
MMPQQQDAIVLANPQNCVARALYDNIAESPDELAFRKGDTLTVLEQNTGGIEGWWLCSLRGRQGICPGNRLRLLAGVYDTGQQLLSENPELLELNTLQRQGKRRSWHAQPNKVLTPQKFGDVYLYDLPPNRNISNQGRYDIPPTAHISVIDGNQGRYSVPPSRSSGSGDTPLDTSGGSESYDIPPRATPVPANYDTPKSCWRTSPAPPGRRDSTDSYDVPRPLGTAPAGGNVLLLQQQQQLTPSSSASSLTADSMSSSNRSSLALAPEYDVPRPTRGGPQLQLHQIQQQLYDVPASNPTPRELPLELNSALDSLARLQSEATAAISKLLAYAGPQWRCKERLEPKLMDIKLAVVRLRTSLHDLAEFGEGALGNAGRAPDKGLAVKLRPLVKALRDADRLVQEAAVTLDGLEWSIDALSRPEEDHAEGRQMASQPPDALDQLVACARALTEDVRQTASFIQGNSTLLFKRASTPPGNNNEWLEDYDYVNLESRESVAQQHAEIRDALPAELRKSYDVLVKEAESAAVISEPKAASGDGELDPNDRQVLTFYAAQTVTYTTHLTHAIDAFLQTVEHNQPPKVFLAHGKFVVLSAHRLVHIGDTVHRNVVRSEVRARVLQCANALSEALAATVHKTKKAALQFPSVTAVQEMVDSVVDISHLARDLKLSMIQAAQQPTVMQ